MFGQEKITYQDQIVPLVEANCGKCHNADKKKADLDLTSYQGALKGSGSGVVLVSGNPDGSKLWKAITHAEEPFMPPNRPALSEKEQETFKKWILGGLIENAGGKAIAAAKPSADLTLKIDTTLKPEGPPPMPQELPLEPIIHSARGTAITGLAGSPWAPLIAVAGQKQVLFFNSDSNEALGILPYTEGQPVEVKFSRSGKLLLASGGRGALLGRVLVWDVATGKRVMTLGDDYDSVLAADIRPDQSQVALGGPGRLVKIFSTSTSELQHKIKKHTEWVTAVAYSPNGQMLATADRNGGISLWDPDSGQELFTLPGHKSAVTALSWRGDSKLLASSSEDGTVKLWDPQEGKQAKSWNAHGSGALCVSYSQDGRLVSCGRDNLINLWDANGGKVRKMEFSGELPLRVVFSYDGKKIFSTDFAGHLAAWTAADGKACGELNPNPSPLAEQIATAQERLAELQARAIESAKNVAAAEAELAKTTGALGSAEKAVEAARAEQTAREKDLARLASPLPAPAVVAASPPAGESVAERRKPSSAEHEGIIGAQSSGATLTEATNAWKDAAAATTDATVTLEATRKQLDAAKANLAKAKSENPEASVAEAKSSLIRLQAAQLITSVFRLRESLAAKKQEQERVLAAAASDAEGLREAEKNAAAASAATVTSKKHAASAKGGSPRSEPYAKRLAVEIKADESRLGQLLAQYRSLTSGSPAVPKQPRS